jgi:hypothetical protein
MLRVAFMVLEVAELVLILERGPGIQYAQGLVIEWRS